MKMQENAVTRVIDQEEQVPIIIIKFADISWNSTSSNSSSFGATLWENPVISWLLHLNAQKALPIYCFRKLLIKNK